MKIKEIKHELEIPSSYICGSKVVLVLENDSIEDINYRDFGELNKSPYPDNEWDDRGCVINRFDANPYPKDGMIDEVYFTKEQYDEAICLFEQLFNGYGECADCN